MIEHCPRARDHARGSHWDQNGIKQSMSRSRDQNKLRVTKIKGSTKFLRRCGYFFDLCFGRNDQAIKDDFKSLDPGRQFSMSDMQVTNPCHGFVQHSKVYSC